LFTINDDIIYHRDKIFIPSRLRKECFNIAHSEQHSGIQSTLRKLHSVWWPQMSQDVSHWVSKCDTCNNIRPITNKSTNHWPSCETFERIHLDYAHVPNVGNVLVIVDAHSAWIEAFYTSNRESTTVCYQMPTHCLLSFWNSLSRC